MRRCKTTGERERGGGRGEGERGWVGEKKISYCKVNKSMNFCECWFAFLYKFRGTPSEKSLFFPAMYIYT